MKKPHFCPCREAVAQIVVVGGAQGVHALQKRGGAMAASKAARIVLPHAGRSCGIPGIALRPLWFKMPFVPGLDSEPILYQAALCARRETGTDGVS